MNEKKMKILIVEDDPTECKNFEDTLKNRDEFELIKTTDSDIEALKDIKSKHPEGIILDIELNRSSNGNVNSFGLIDEIKKLKYQPIIIVTTHIYSTRTYEMLHRNGVDIILYKNHPKYSSDYVLNELLVLRDLATKNTSVSQTVEEFSDNEKKISELICHHLDEIGVTSKLKGRKYIHDAILYLIQNENSDVNVSTYLSNIYKKAGNTITNGMQNAIIHAWRVSSPEDLEKLYTEVVNYETGVPTPMEFVYYYAKKIKKEI